MVFEIKKDKEKFGEFLMSNGGGWFGFRKESGSVTELVGRSWISSLLMKGRNPRIDSW